MEELTLLNKERRNLERLNNQRLARILNTWKLGCIEGLTEVKFMYN